MSAVISVTGLSKRYRLRHESPRYRSLREELTAAIAGAIRHPFGRRHKCGAASVEDFWALKDVSFTAEKGDRLGIIGRNGAGKSTLLKILSRITDPTEGRVEIAGRVSSLLEVGTGFHPELSGRENIFLNGAILGMRAEEVRRKFDRIVAFAEVERFLDTPVKHYSSGMYVRLAFAVAAHLEPDVLVVDEVLAVGDVQFQQKCLGRMEELSRSGRTILFVTHNVDAMLALCNRGLVLDKGKVIFDGEPAEARRNYISHVSAAEYSVGANARQGGSGGVAFKSVWVSAGESTHATVESGSTISLYMHAQVDGEYRKRTGLQVAFGVDTIEGQSLYTALSSWKSSPIDPSSGEIRVACDIDSVPLIPGRYLVSATILFHGEVLDSIQHCTSFDVVPKSRAVHVERPRSWGPLDLPFTFRNIENKHRAEVGDAFE
jgi:lipopolysaccharide transport system ATP-binding protein